MREARVDGDGEIKIVNNSLRISITKFKGDTLNFQ